MLFELRVRQQTEKQNCASFLDKFRSDETLLLTVCFSRYVLFPSKRNNKTTGFIEIKVGEK